MQTHQNTEVYREFSQSSANVLARAPGLAARQPTRHVALLLERKHHLRTQTRIVELARQLNWRVHNLKHHYNLLPDNLLVDGALTDQLWDSQLVNQLHSRACPSVRIGRFPSWHEGAYPAVAPDLKAITELAAGHLADRNFRHVGFIAYTDMHLEHYYEPFRMRAAELGCQPHLLRVRDLSSRETALDPIEKMRIRDLEIIEWLREIPKPIGILGFHEYMAARICTLSLSLGVEVPGEIGIVACGDDPLVCECAPIQLSAVPTVGPHQGDVAVELLQRLMNGDSPPGGTVLVAPKHISVRESTDVLATTSPEVAKAVRFMWNNLRYSLSVEDIAVAVQEPRRKLERAFRQELGRGVNAEFLRRRMEYCCELLRSTDLAVIDILPMIGFSSPSYLHKVFRQTFGMTPLQWRRERTQEFTNHGHTNVGHT